MESSTPNRTAPSRPGRFHRGRALAVTVLAGGLQQSRHHPIPAPSAEPPGELTYGEALTLLKLAMLPTPAIWRDAAGIIDAMVQGDASAAETIVRHPWPTPSSPSGGWATPCC